MPPPKSQRKYIGPRGNSHSLAALCCLCGRKKPLLSRVSPSLEGMFRQYIPHYSLSSNLHPTTVCTIYRLTLKAFEKNPEQTARKFPPLMDYDTLFPRSSRSSGQVFWPEPGVLWSCCLCDIVRLSLDYPAWHAQHSRQAGCPAKAPLDRNTITIYSISSAQYGKGLTRNCLSKRITWLTWSDGTQRRRCPL